MFARYIPAALVAAALSFATFATAAAHDFTVLRGVDANVNNGNATLGAAQFGFTGAPPTLSTFNSTANAVAAGSNKACYLHIVITGLPNAVPVAGDQGTVTPANGHVYNVTFDNVPVGHWSIALGAQPQATGRADFSAYAQANRVFTNGAGLAPGVNCH